MRKPPLFHFDRHWLCLPLLLSMPFAQAEEHEDSSQDGHPHHLELKKAKWDAEDRELVIQGEEAKRNAQVQIKNAMSGAVLAVLFADEEGEFKAKLRGLETVPCRVRAESEGASDERLVKHAPDECDSGNTTPPPTDPPPIPAESSINSTSQNGLPGFGVAEQPFVNRAGYRVFGSNDLGMHCGDFDTRISSILPPFNVLHAQVIQRGPEPKILTPSDGIALTYSAASNPKDPVLSGVNSAGDGPVLSSLAKDGTLFKTNFWDTALAGYRAFYPPGILEALTPDQGLPVPNVERLWLGDGTLSAEQQDMPGRTDPYGDNLPQLFKLFTGHQPFFVNFPFGYVSQEVNWFEAAGVPLTAFDDSGRENPWPLYRLQARDAQGQILASTDVVVPISGEANCGVCHNAPIDGGNGTATQALVDAGIQVATVLDDPQFDVSVPLAVSKEYAADFNILRLHDLKHRTDLEANTPVVCQSCHYSPALDLAQVGPKGPGDGNANGRQQTQAPSMSHVMHSHHAQVKDLQGNPLFPTMPPAVDSQGNPRDPTMARNLLQETCYQCHPGRRTDCLRGAMANGGMVCQDCHGQMAQVGDDFSKFVSPDNPGDFRLAGDFYTNPNTLRVPWANEPGCGSCHTGDVLDNLRSEGGTLNAPNDQVRLIQAYRIGDPKATPIVPTNKRFAENTAPNGNPMLYRLSKGHQGVFCEACHGATHGIWPNKNPAANDNVTAQQLQGHSGTIIECDTCHTGDLGITLEGPHGMHPVGNAGLRFIDGGHEDLAERNPDACRACHGRNGEGSVLSRTAVARDFSGFEHGGPVPKGHPVSCTDCHENEL